MMWLILAAALAMAVLSVRAGLRRRGRERSASVAADLDGILFWGGFAAALGVLGTVIGVSQMARAVQAAGSVSPGLAWSGLRVALVTTVFGLGTFVLALLVWFALRWLDRRALDGGAPIGAGRLPAPRGGVR